MTDDRREILSTLMGLGDDEGAISKRILISRAARAISTAISGGPKLYYQASNKCSRKATDVLWEVFLDEISRHNFPVTDHLLNMSFYIPNKKERAGLSLRNFFVKSYTNPLIRKYVKGGLTEDSSSTSCVLVQTKDLDPAKVGVILARDKMIEEFDLTRLMYLRVPITQEIGKAVNVLVTPGAMFYVIPFDSYIRSYANPLV